MGLITDTYQTYYEGANQGNYQFVSLDAIVNNFYGMYVGADKTITRIRKTDVLFHARRAMQEFSYDIFRQVKDQEIEIGPSLSMQLPQDYVSWSKVAYIDDAGVERTIYPIRKSGNPISVLQDSNYDYTFDGSGNLLLANESIEWTRFQGNDTVDTNVASDDDTLELNDKGGRYGIDPEFANSNGGFYIDDTTGTIKFSADLVGKIVVLKYVSDGLGADGDMIVHKFAEKAMYETINAEILSILHGIPEYKIQRARKAAFAARRVAKLRLSKLNLEELTQVLRGKSKQIKH